MNIFNSVDFKADGQDYFAVALLEGAFYVKLSLKGQVFERSINIPGIQFHNNNWHSIRIIRKIKKVNAFQNKIKYKIILLY